VGAGREGRAPARRTMLENALAGEGTVYRPLRGES
jgi:hypothetical protein